MRTPPLLPLTAIAILGCIALSLLREASHFPALFQSSNAEAEDKAAIKTTSLPNPSVKVVALASNSSSSGALPSSDWLNAKPAVALGSPPPACVTSPADLAREAGLSPGELQSLQSLTSRRGQLDARERALDTQLQLLAATDAKVDSKLKALTVLKSEIKDILRESEVKISEDIDRLVTVYSKMKPKDGAMIMATLEDDVRIPVAAKMKEKDLAAILALMPTVDAKKITETLAHRHDKLKNFTATFNDAQSQPNNGYALNFLSSGTSASGSKPTNPTSLSKK